MKIRKVVRERSDLTYAGIKSILVSQREAKVGKLEEYIFDEE
ncbi:hypothetical protein ACFLYU_04285 [Candidatus Dependentiae bacterium]